MLAAVGQKHSFMFLRSEVLIRSIQPLDTYLIAHLEYEINLQSSHIGVYIITWEQIKTQAWYNIKINKMRRRLSPTRSKVLQEMTVRQEQEVKKTPINRAADYNRYFCHYNNAVYMGGMSSYKKHGKGILLHDDGSAAITEYIHDTPTGHNVIFRENSITSVHYKAKDQFQVAYKQGKYVINLPFSDSSLKVHGVGALIDYVHFRIYKLVFKKGSLVEKVMHCDKKDNDDVFYRNVVTDIIGVKHDQAFNGDFKKPDKVHFKQTQHKSTIGYFDQGGEMHGLSFSFYGENICTNGEKSLYLNFIEKGYYRESLLQTFGEKLFKNGNKYIGEFDKGDFHGYGILICPSQMKWVYGKFDKGQMNEIVESNHKKFTEDDFKVWSGNLRAIHKRYRQRWIDMEIELPQENYLYIVLKMAIEMPTTYVDPDKIEVLRNDQYRMSRIQLQFQKQHPGGLHNSYVQTELNRHYAVKNTSPSKKLHLKKPIQKANGTQAKKQKRIIQHLNEAQTKKQKKSIQKVNQALPKKQNRSIQKFDETEGKKSPEKAYVNYRQQDPFSLSQSNLLVASRNKEQAQPRMRISKLQARPPLGELASRYSKQKYLPGLYNPYRQKYRSEDQINRIYRTNYYERLKKEDPTGLEDHQLWLSRLKRGIEASPVHRNYYSTPTKYGQGYLSRYAGKISNYNLEYDQNGRRRTYLTNSSPAKNYLGDETTIYSNTRADSPSPQKRNKNPQIQKQSYNDKKQTQGPKKGQQSQRNLTNPYGQYRKDRNY